MFKPAIAASFAAMAALCVAAPAASAQEETGSRCVQLRNITGYNVIDDRHVLLNSGASRHFLITTSTRCSGLRFGIQIGASFDDNERLCPPLVEHLVTDDGWRCPIETIEPVADIDAARRLVEERSADENSED